VQCACLDKIRHATNDLEGRVELQEWFRPQLAFVQLLLNDLENRGIGRLYVLGEA
jgi:hypothetical protein